MFSRRLPGAVLLLAATAILADDAAGFLALPESRREALRRLDRQLQDEPAVSRERLERVMDRYAAWLERLPEADRRSVLEAPSAADRLAAVREVREREWLQRLPLARRQELEALAGRPGEHERLARVWKEDQRRGEEQWRLAAWGVPLHTEEFRREVQAWTDERLRPRLSPEDAERLRAAEQLRDAGDLIGYARALKELGDRNPAVLPGPASGPTQWDDLPAEVRGQLPPRARDALRQRAGRWPEYAIGAVELARKRGTDKSMLLGPGQADDPRFSPAERQFLRDELAPKLTPAESQRLTQAAGRWPDYPRLVLELARAHRLAVPGMQPPGDPEGWTRLRAGRKAG